MNLLCSHLWETFINISDLIIQDMKGKPRNLVGEVLTKPYLERFHFLWTKRINNSQLFNNWINIRLVTQKRSSVAETVMTEWCIFTVTISAAMGNYAIGVIDTVHHVLPPYSFQTGLPGSYFMFHCLSEFLNWLLALWMLHKEKRWRSEEY